MVCPVLHVARVDMTVWAGSSDYIKNLLISHESAKSQDQEIQEDDKSKLGDDC
jgi:hypothetical protein